MTEQELAERAGVREETTWEEKGQLAVDAATVSAATTGVIAAGGAVAGGVKRGLSGDGGGHPEASNSDFEGVKLRPDASQRKGDDISSANEILFSKNAGPHRLAKPIELNYKTYDERLKDPACILEDLLRGSDGADRPERRKHGRELASGASLRTWAEGHRKVFEPQATLFAFLKRGGGEHSVVFDDATGRLFKLTKPGLFGAQAEDAGAYLERMALSNRVFGDDVQIEGIVILPGEDGPRLVTSQSFVKGRDATMAEQGDYLTSKGFVEHEGRWVHPINGVAVWDTVTPGNVIMKPDGTMQAVDLQIESARPEELRAVREQTGFGREPFFAKGDGEGKAGEARLKTVGTWTEEILSGWGSKLDVTIHESGEGIADPRLRKAVLEEGGNVAAFFDPQDGRIHLLADRVGSKADAERLIRHEGVHWALRGPMKKEYARVLEQIGRSIRWEDLQETIAKYPKGTPDLWIEEHLAKIGETNPQSPVWKRAVAAMRQILRSRFGADIVFSDSDIKAFLTRANRRFEQAGESDRAYHDKESGSDDLLFAKNKKKQGQDRKSWSEVRKGDNWNSVKKHFKEAKENVEAPKFFTSGTKDEVVRRAAEFLKENAVVTDWTGRTVYLPYGQTEGSYGRKEQVLNRAEHVVCRDEKQGSHQRVLDIDKARWLAAVPATISEGAVRVSRGSSVYYFRNYNGAVHMVVTSSEGIVINQDVIDGRMQNRGVGNASYHSGLVTQFGVSLNELSLDEGFVQSVRLLPTKERSP